MSPKILRDTLRDLFSRRRMPGDLVFAAAFMLFSLFLLYHLPDQAEWRGRRSIVAEPAFWPTISVLGMVAFAALHLAGSLASPRLDGRWREVVFWLRASEFGGWFLAYVMILPTLGYLPSSLLFATLLSLRLGYRSARALGWAAQPRRPLTGCNPGNGCIPHLVGVGNNRIGKE